MFLFSTPRLFCLDLLIHPRHRMEYSQDSFLQNQFCKLPFSKVYYQIPHYHYPCSQPSALTFLFSSSSYWSFPGGACLLSGGLCSPSFFRGYNLYSFLLNPGFLCYSVRTSTSVCPRFFSFWDWFICFQRFWSAASSSLLW